MSDELESKEKGERPLSESRQPNWLAQYLARIALLVGKPSTAWDTILKTDLPWQSPFLLYYAPGVLMWLAGSTLGYAFLGLHYPVIHPVSGDFVLPYVYPDKEMTFAQQSLFAAFYLVLPFLLSKPLFALIRIIPERLGGVTGKDVTLKDARRVILYSYAPVFAASIVIAVQLLNVLSAIMVVYGWVIFYKGLSPNLQIRSYAKGIVLIVSMIVVFLYHLIMVQLAQDLVGNPFEDAALATLQNEEIFEASSKE